MELADKLLALRKNLGLTQAHAAKKIDIQQSYLSKLENGHYVPSQDVLVKLCIAYNVKSEELVPSPRKSSKQSMVASALTVFAIALILSGYFTLFFPQTYYTYKISPVEQVTSSSIQLRAQVTDQYLGDMYVKKLSDINYKFELLSQREVSRKENRWIIAIGVLMLVVSVGYLFVSFMGSRKTNGTLDP